MKQIFENNFLEGFRRTIPLLVLILSGSYLVHTGSNLWAFIFFSSLLINIIENMPDKKENKK